MKPSRRDGAPERDRCRSAMYRRQVVDALASVFDRIRLGYERVGSSNEHESHVRLQPAIILQRTPYTRARPTAPLPYALRQSPPSEAQADTPPRKPWEKRSAKRSAE